jgi:hypothetical protein
MSTHADNFIGNILKNWVMQFRPPANGRAQLLTSAIAAQRKSQSYSAFFPCFHTEVFPAYEPNEWSQAVCTWFSAQFIHASVLARV